MKKSLQTFGLSLFVVLAFLTIGIGFLFGINNPVPWIMIAVLISLPYINKKLLARRFVAWSDNLSTGIESIDDDHKKLLTLINNLQTAVYYPTGEAFERQAINELVEYTKYHFGREEQLMSETGYDDFDAHRKEHERMVAKVGEFLAAYDKDREGTIDEMLQFLKEWLINHIAGSDQKYAPYLRSHGVE